MTWNLCRLMLSLGMSLAVISTQAQTAIPKGSVMELSKPGTQHLLLNPLVARESVSVPNRDAVFATALIYPGIESKMGMVALKLQDVAKDGNYEINFRISHPPSCLLEQLGLWVYLAADSNVARVGLSVVDKEGEVLSNVVPADWQGWKWIEMSLIRSEFKPAFAQPGKNGRIDAPLKEIRLIWFAKAAGPTWLGANGLAAVAQSAPAADPCALEMICLTEGNPAVPFHGKLLVHNITDKPLDVDASYSIQRNPLLYDQPLIDPVLGSNRAMGQKSWVEIDGKRIEDSTLTDGDNETAFSSEWVNDHYTEGFQFVDLGQERKILRVDYQNGDTTWIRKVDISASTNGNDYTSVEGLQELDLHKEWGLHTLPVKRPFTARYLRLRYHGSPGAKATSVIRTIAELYVYDGSGSDFVGIPKVGEFINQKDVHITVAPKTFALLSMDSDAPLPAGSYYFGIEVKGAFGTRLFGANHFVPSASEIKLRPESRFGINAAGASNIPLLAEMGFAWIRFENMKWGFFNTSPTDFLLNGTVARSDVPFDDYMQAYHAAGMSTLPCIFQTPGWASSAPEASTPNIGGYPPKNYNDYGKAVFEAVARYGATRDSLEDLHTPDKKTGLGLVTTYEIWNEPNLNDPNWGFFVGSLENYLDLFRVGAEAVKHADTNSRVCAGAFSGLSMRDVNQLNSYKYPDGKDALDFADILSVHFYSGREEPELATDDPNTNRSGDKTPSSLTYEQELTDIADWRDDLKPGMPIWLTETGNDVGGPIGRSERFQAAKLPRDFMIALANGVEKVFLYRETGSNPIMHGGAGVIRHDASLRPSFFTLSILARELDGVTDVRTPRLITSDPSVWLYHWKRGNDYVVTAWTPKDSVPIGLNLGKCHVVDAFGYTCDVNVDEKFPLNIFPVYITQIGNTGPIDTLVAKAYARSDQHKKLRVAMARLHAYLYQFGSDKYLGLKNIGTPRPFTAVLATNIYDPGKGYGLGTTGGKNDDQRKWMASIFDKTSVDFDTPNTFRVDVAPGTYDVEFKAIDAADNAKLIIKGDEKGPITLTFANRGRDAMKTQITVAVGNPVIFDFPAGIEVEYLSLIEILNLLPD